MPVTGRYLGSYVPPEGNSIDLANLLDTSGNGHHLMFGGSVTPSFDADPFGIDEDGLIFGGTMQAAAYGPDWSLPATAFTYQFRIKRDTDHLGVVQGVFGRWATVKGNREFQFLCFFDASNKLNFIVSATNSAGSAAQVSVGVITDGLAHAVEFSLSAGVISAYLDGLRIATVAAVAAYTPPASVAMEFGTYGDESSVPAGGLPFYGVLGDFMLSSIARHTGASYTVSVLPAVADANTLALLPMSAAFGNYIETPAYQGSALIRTGHSAASGGWANPDGPLPQIGGGYYFTASAYNGSIWTVWAVTASDLATLMSGGGTLGASAIQTPADSEGNIAGNGSVVPFLGQYWHFFHDGSPKIRYSTGASLGAPFSPQPGHVLFGGYADPWVRVSADGSTLTMYMVNTQGSRSVWVTTSVDGTTWTTPVEVITDMTQAGYSYAPGEFSATNFIGASQWAFSDGAPDGTTARDVVGWGTLDGMKWLPLFVRLTAASTGSDAGGSPYISVYDLSPTWDNDGRQLIFLATHSTNNQPTQPTDSDVGVWFANVAGT